MQKKLRITVEGKVYDVTVEELTENGHAAPSYPSIAGTGASSSVVAAPLSAPMPHVPAAAPAASAVSGAEICPLGGVVESVDVTVGQKISQGDRIAVVEAMKMKTPVHANHSGTVASIAIKPGDPVEAGAVLMTIA